MVIPTTVYFLCAHGTAKSVTPLISLKKNHPIEETLVRIHKKVEKFGIHEYQKIWYAKS